MTRMTRAKQERLESIMNLVEQLGTDRVLGRLRQTKMMSKEVLDDMKEWDTDNEKRMALLGFLVSPEGKNAFGALYELAKVHEEQLKYQEEQEKLLQEQMSRQTAPDLRKYGRGKASTASMKSKLRQQMARRRDPQPANNAVKVEATPLPPTPQAQKIAIPPASKPALRNAATAVVAKKAQPKEPVKDSEPSMPSDGLVSKPIDEQEHPVKQRAKEKKNKDRKSPSPVQGVAPRSRRNSDGNENGLDLSLTGSAAIPTAVVKPAVPLPEPDALPVPAQEPPSPELDEVSPEITADDGHWWQKEEKESEPTDEETQEEMPIAGDRLPPEGANPEDNKETGVESTGTTPIKKVRISDSVTVLEPRDSTTSSTPSTATSTPILKRRKLDEIHQKLERGDITVDELTMDHIKEIVADWRNMKRDRGPEEEHLTKELQHAKDDLRKSVEEKDRIRKEKDKYVFKEFELQQKLQDQVAKYKSLREDHESLKQGHHQSQQSSRKSIKINQEMKKKIAKLESKIKSYDKVTVRKGTQTTEVFDKDVHESLRIAEESLQVTQSELKEALTKSKASQQEADDLKKQLNAKGREINKRERKSKKDEESMRAITRDRDALETKLRKVTEQLEYYKGMLEIRTKGGKRPEKKEVKVQRCSSGRHIILKTQVAPCQKDDDTKTSGKDEDTKPSTKAGTKTSSTSNSSKQGRQAMKQTPSKQSGSQPKSSTDTTKNNAKSPVGTTSTDQKPPKPSTPAKDNTVDATQPDKAASSKQSSSPETPRTKSILKQSAPAEKTQSAAKDSANTKTAQKQSPSRSTEVKPVRPKAATVRTTNAQKK